MIEIEGLAEYLAFNERIKTRIQEIAEVRKIEGELESFEVYEDHIDFSFIYVPAETGWEIEHFYVTFPIEYLVVPDWADRLRADIKQEEMIARVHAALTAKY